MEPRRNVHPVAEQIAAPDHHVADVNADPELEAAILGRVCVCLPKLLLYGSTALDCVHCAWKLG
ncbi:hypothetical protein BQ8482_410006 [Mesorhizobium delmotii]|uniref:Uncharacterized protein n=1 Tax=Mesorhizobium delmotii TaxID=1631247 RepID=A0A2P9AT46_9HYPH|nr:hypothetical protein BQ8482_410006 [Mesorhizobium delmotii]